MKRVFVLLLLVGLFTQVSASSYFDNLEFTDQCDLAFVGTGWKDIKSSLAREADYSDHSGELFATRVVLCPRSARSFKIVLIAN